MAVQDEFRSQVRYARMAGLMYLVVIGVYIAGDVVRSRVEGDGEFLEVSRRIVAAEHLYRLGLCIQFTEMLLTLWLAVGLYVAVRPANRNLALAAFSSRLAEVVLGGIWVVLQFAGFLVHLAVRDADASGQNYLKLLADLCSRSSSVALNCSAIFFGMGSTIFFYLFLRSRFIPRILSWLGLLASVLVCAVCFTKLLWPEYADLADRGWLPMGIAEVATGLWLLIRGVNRGVAREAESGLAAA